MSDGTVVAKVLLCPIQDGLGESHESHAKSQHGRWWPLSDVGKVEVGDVQESFDDVQEGCKRICAYQQRITREAVIEKRTLSIGETISRLEVG